MRNLIYVVLSLMILSSCGKDSECSISDLVGQWKGNEDCGLLGTKTVTVNITAATKGENSIDIDAPGAFIDAETLSLDGCSLSGGSTVLGSGVEIKGTSTDSTKLNLTYAVKALGTTTTSCSYALTR